MSVKSFESAFREPSRNASKTLDEIQQLMKLYLARGDAKILQFSHTIMVQMCKAIVGGGTNYELYSDVFFKVLAPNVDPRTSPKYWSAFLEMVRYFYYLHCERKLFTVMMEVYDWISPKPNKLQNERDYEFLLGLYTQHLMLLKCDFEASSDYEQRLQRICNDLSKLFGEMLEKNKELNFVYSDLLKNVMRFLITKKTHKFIVSASNNASQMFDALFAMMASLRGPQIRVEEAQDLYMDYMAAVMNFVAMDTLIVAAGTTSERVTLRFLRAARDVNVFKSHKNMAYTLSLLYYFQKFAYCLDGGGGGGGSEEDHAQSYAEYCENFRKFLANNSEILKTEQWFMEFVVVMILQLSQQDVCKSRLFGGAVVHGQVVRQHLLLMTDFIKLASSISQTKLMSWTCCTSTRKHAILSLVRVALKIYTLYVASVEKENLALTAADEINKTFTSIMRHNVQVIDSMACISSSSAELQSFHTTFLCLLAKIQLPAQVKLCIGLTESLLKLKPKFTQQMWFQFFVRLRRAAPLTKDSKIITEMHALKIAHMLKLKDYDYSQLLNEIGIYYTTEHLLVWEMCLLEVLETCTSPLKPLLDAHEKQLLHTFETQIVAKYQRTNLLVYTSLLKCSPTQLNFVLVSRECSELDVYGKVRRVYVALKRKADKSGGLGRVDKLTLAYACVTLANEQVDSVKKVFDYQQQKDFSEETLDIYLIIDKVKRININVEMKLIELILEGVECFEDFFKMADLEPLTSQEMLMDWEAMMNDISFLARLLQLRGYIEYACRAWLLLYSIANFLGDSNNIARTLAFLCEHAPFIEQYSEIDLLNEITQKQQIIVHSLENIQALVPRRQNYTLSCLIQMAFYYARQCQFSYAYILLNLVETKRNELPERQDKFDFILGSLQAVRFRILWKFMDKSEAVPTTDSVCILRQIEETFSRFRGFVYISSEDSLNYMILLFGLLQEFNECTINRLCDSNVKSFFVSILKGALDTGATLRVVQILTTWAMANLQMERVDKAQCKLEIIECFLNVRNVQDLINSKGSCAAQLRMAEAAAHSNERYKEQNNRGLQVVRKVAQTQLSPVMRDKLTLSAQPCGRRDLQRFTNETLTKNNFMQWVFLAVDSINARLLFLIEEHAELEQFYRAFKTWCQKQQNQTLLIHYQNMQLQAMQHYLNYLRATKQFGKALGFVEGALSFFEKSKRNVDKSYLVNLEVQKRATQYEMLYGDIKARESLGKLRRVLRFSPEEERKKKCVQWKDRKRIYAAEDDDLNSAFIANTSPECDGASSINSLDLSPPIQMKIPAIEIVPPTRQRPPKRVEVDEEESSPPFSKSDQITVIEVENFKRPPKSVIKSDESNGAISINSIDLSPPIQMKIPAIEIVAPTRRRRPKRVEVEMTASEEDSSPAFSKSDQITVIEVENFKRPPKSFIKSDESNEAIGMNSIDLSPSIQTNIPSIEIVPPARQRRPKRGEVDLTASEEESSPPFSKSDQITVIELKKNFKRLSKSVIKSDETPPNDDNLQTAEENCNSTPTNLPTLKTSKRLNKKKTTSRNTNKNACESEEDALNKGIEQINLVDSKEDEENNSAAVDKAIAFTEDDEDISPVVDKAKGDREDSDDTHAVGQNKIVIEKSTNKRTNKLYNDFVNKMASLDIASPETPSPPNITIIENPAFKRVTRNRPPRPLTCVNIETPTSTSNTVVKKRGGGGRSKKTEADIEVIKENVVERSRTRRR